MCDQDIGKHCVDLSSQEKYNLWSVGVAYRLHKDEDKDSTGNQMAAICNNLGFH